MRTFQKINIAIQPAFLIYLALSLLLLPVRLVFAWFVAVSWHEISHFLMLRAMNVEIYSVTIGINGAEIETEHMMNCRELLCALAGPLGGCVLAFFIRIYPELAVCALLHSIYNMLPIYPLDGGRILRCMLYGIKIEDYAMKIALVAEWVVFAILLVAAVYCTVILRLGILPLIFVGLLLVKNKSVKFPCKRAEQIVQ